MLNRTIDDHFFPDVLYQYKLAISGNITTIFICPKINVNFTGKVCIKKAHNRKKCVKEIVTFDNFIIIHREAINEAIETSDNTICPAFAGNNAKGNKNGIALGG